MEGQTTIQATLAVGAQLERLRDALESEKLPAADIELPGRTFFEFALSGNIVGWGGFETYGADGLLRSLVVERAYRSKGVGTSLLNLLELKAAELGIIRLHLLTTSASSFFEQMGYENLPRGAAPALISLTEQFKGLCPGSAYYMSKALR
ncbi:arsenic resistance N-acetyltransferase ArsN2 [Pseudomonas sp. R1-7]|uniref:arsenic resistance N-acetyltransferase ArsN2 n=1 Tax=Pseudomonas sp. R1-7 TaxID=2817398 RepID=UPI003DAA2C15